MKENPSVYSISFRAFCENEFEWSKNIETGSHYSAKVNKYDHTAGGRLSLSFFICTLLINCLKHECYMI